MKKDFKKYICFLFLLVMILLSKNIYAAEDKVEATINGTTKQFATISDALLEIIDNEETTIKLLDDIEIGSKITIPSNKNIIIDGDNKYTITYLKKADNTWYTGQLFEIKANSKVVFQNLTIDGQNNWTLDNEAYFSDLQKSDRYTNFTKYIITEENKPNIKAYMFSNAGNLILENVIIKNCFNTRGIVYASSATTTFKDTSIIHNTTHDGGLAIYQIGANTKTYIEGKTLIDDNYAIGNGGIFRISGGSKLEMNGGTISNNKSINSNGVVAMVHQTGSKFVLNNGSIIGNSGISGKNNGRNGMIYVHSGSTFIMNGGTIAENRGQATGGIDAPGYANSNVELNAGEIKNNKADEKADYNTDAYLADFDLTIGENMYIEGDIYVAGDIVNNGKIKGDVTLGLGKNIEKTIDGTGIIDGDVVLNYSGETIPTIDENVKITGKIETTNTDKYTTVRFFYNGGVDENENTQAKIIIEINTEPTIPIISREGHTFLGWYADKELTKTWESGPIGTDTSVYAKWEINSYVLTWKIENQETQETLVYGDKIILPEVEPTKEGYNFIGWENYQEGMTMPGKDLTIAAIFQKIEEPKPEDDIKEPETDDDVKQPEVNNPIEQPEIDLPIEEPKPEVNDTIIEKPNENVEVLKPDSDIENPKTNDYVIRSIIILIISIIGLFIIRLHIKNNKRAK